MSNSTKKFIVIGNTGNSYGKKLVNKFKNDTRIIFTGAMFDQQKLIGIVKYSAVYFHGHSVGGTNPSLLEAMADGAFIAAHSNPFNKSILKENALYFNNVKEVSAIIDQHEKLYNEDFIRNNYARIKNDYTWEKVIGQYDHFFRECYEARRITPFTMPVQLTERLVETE